MENKNHTADVQVYQLPVETKKAVAEFSERIKKATEIMEAVKKFFDTISHEYDVIQYEYEAYFNNNDREGIIKPYDVDKFVYWLCSQYPDEPIGYLVNYVKDPKYYRLYHEYRKSQFEGSQEQEKTLQLSDLIDHDNRFDIVEGIKSKYKNIGGKRLKLLLMALQELDLIPEYNYNRKFHDCCRKEFNWDIKSYQAMNDYLYNEQSDHKELESIKEYIKTLMNTK